MAEILTRKQEILRSVDNLIEVHDAWAKEPGTEKITRPFELALTYVFNTCQVGDVPQSCRKLLEAISSLHEEFVAYFDRNEWSTGQKPLQSFWRAFRRVMQEREGGEVRDFEPMRPEPVKILLDQGVSARQIAMHIYSDGGKPPRGPFIGDGGQVLERKIYEEAEKPGRHVPEDWLPLSEVQRIERLKEEAQTRLESIENREKYSAADDPATIQELITEGAFPGQIARVKRVSVQQVLKIAREMGLGVTDDGRYVEQESIEEPTAEPTEEAPVEPETVDEPEIEDVETDEDELEEVDDDYDIVNPLGEEEIEQQIVDLHALESELSIVELTERVNTTFGLDMTWQKVNSILKSSKKQG